MSSFSLLCMVALLSVLGMCRGRLNQVDSNGNWISADAPLVNMELYYESLCPDCKEFITKQLYPTVLKVGSIMNVTIIPYGNAQEKPAGDQWVFTCQHGPKECKGNIIHTCALNLNAAKQDQKLRVSMKLLTFVFCMEKSEDPVQAGPMCASKMGLDWNAISQCTVSDQGNKWQHMMALQTEALNPPHTWVPWIVLNGVHNDQIQAEATADLIQLICDTYQGTRPTNCPP